MDSNHTLRRQVAAAIAEALQQRREVVAGWEGGSTAFDASDTYSDIDLNFLIADDASVDALYAASEESLAKVSPITASHSVPPGRYYKLEAGGPFFMVDLCFFRVGAGDRHLEAERHGNARPLFDKGDWLRIPPLDVDALKKRQNSRLEELRTWFPVSQSFVRKAILRQQHVEACGGFWGHTLRPLAELLRMRYCPVRWDFGIRYLDRDLPQDVYDRFRNLMFIRDLDELGLKLESAVAWGDSLLQELK
jgi:hypothetical protein